MARTPVLYLTTASIALSIGHGPAQAQQVAQAQPSSQLEEVVITAQKRTEKLSDAPVAASVINEATLTDANVSDISDINKLAPSVNLNGTFNGRVPLAVRGIQSDSNEAAIGVASGVGIQVDGVPVPSDSFAGNDMEDVEAVEVLKGPQATLGGRTATSGMINIRTHDPSATWTGSLTGTITDDDEHHIQGFIAGPVTDKIEVSLDGWGHYLVFPVKNLATDQNSHSDDYGFRDKILIKPTDDLDIKLTTRWSSFQSYGGNFAYTYIQPGATLLGVPSFVAPFLTVPALLPGINVNSHNTNYASPVLGAGEHHDDFDFVANIDWRLGDYTLSSITAYQHEERKDVQDLFAVDAYFLDELAHAPLFNNTQDVWTNTSQTSQEVKIASPLDQRINFVAGVFYSDTTVDGATYRVFLGPSATEVVAVNSDTSTVAVYGRANGKLTDDLTLSVGARFNWDSLSYTDIQSIYNGVFLGPSPFPPYTPILGADSSSSTAFVGDVGLKYQIQPEWMVYGTYTRGYAPAVYNTAGTITIANPHLDLVGQEHIDSFELGSKGRFLDDTVQVDGALFDTVYHNYQIQTFMNNGGIDPPLVTTAAGEAETKGAELDAVWKPTPDTRLSFDGAYTLAMFNKFDAGPCYWGSSAVAGFVPPGCYLPAGSVEYKANLTGRAMPNAPHFTFRTAASQVFALGSLPYSLEAGGDVYYRSSAMMVPDNNPHAYQSGFATLNLHATLLHEDGDYQLTLFVNNVTNTHYNVDVEDFWTGPWQSNAVVAQPARDTDRYFGARFAYQF